MQNSEVCDAYSYASASLIVSRVALRAGARLAQTQGHISLTQISMWLSISGMLRAMGQDGLTLPVPEQSPGEE